MKFYKVVRSTSLLGRLGVSRYVYGQRSLAYEIGRRTIAPVVGGVEHPIFAFSNHQEAYDFMVNYAIRDGTEKYAIFVGSGKQSGVSAKYITHNTHESTFDEFWERVAADTLDECDYLFSVFGSQPGTVGLSWFEPEEVVTVIAEFIKGV